MDETITCTLIDVPGYMGKYKANPTGQIVRVYGGGKMSLLTQYLHHKHFMVKLTMNGTSMEIPAATIILKTFRNPCKNGMVPHHRNGIKSDNRLDNLAYITREELGRKTGKMSRSQSVLKLNTDGTIVDVYRSAREAGRQNHMSYQTVMDRCNGKVKNAFSLDGHTYVWEDSAVSMRKAIQLIKIKN